MHPACNPHRRCQNSVQTTRTGGADAGKSACTSMQGAARCKEMPLHLGAGAGRPELNRLKCKVRSCIVCSPDKGAIRVRRGEVARSALKSPGLHARCPRSSTAVGGVEVGPSAAAALRVGWSEL